MSYKITILGCGNSEGTPAIGNNWGACDPHEPKNRRRRPCVLVQSTKTTIVIDTGPDFREQINDVNVEAIDAALYTHAHGDHVNGIDDLRIFARNSKSPIDVYADQAAMAELIERFPYLFEQKSEFYPVLLNQNFIEAFDEPMSVGDIHFTPFLQDHGTCTSLGFRFGDIAYSTDLAQLSDESIETLAGISTWIIDAAGFKMKKNLIHLTLERVYELNRRVGAKSVYLTHMTKGMDYKSLMDELPEGYEPAYDGLILQAST